MKKIILSALCFFLILSANAQSAIVKWAGHLGGSGDEHVTDVATDREGNVYTTGWVSGLAMDTADFDPGPGVYNLTHGNSDFGSYDIFISKLDRSGNFVWAKEIGGAANDEAYSIATDTAGNVYITGCFTGTVDFDPGPGVQNASTGWYFTQPHTDLFLLKLDTNGNFIWVNNMGGGGFNTFSCGESVTADIAGNVYVKGQLGASTDVDPGTGVTLMDGEFVLKSDSGGNFIWAKEMGDNIDDIKLFAVDTSGNVYTAGYFNYIADFDPGPGTYNMVPSGGYDIFISKLDVNGNLAWVKQIGGRADDRPVAIALDASANVFITGIFRDTVDFNPDTATVNLISAGGADIFILKLDTDGDFVWVKSIGGTADDGVDCLAAGTSDSIYIAGNFNGTVDVDPGSGIYNVVSAGDQDFFISRLDGTGNFVWAKEMGGPARDQVAALTKDLNGNIVATGMFDGTSDFGAGEGPLNITSAGGDDIFVVKIGASAVGINQYVNDNSVSVYPNPAENIINIAISQPVKKMHLEIYNTLGELVYKKEITGELNMIDISSEAKGLYFVKVISDHEIITTKKIIKE